MARGKDGGFFFRQGRQAITVMKFQVVENFGEVGALTLADCIQSPERRVQNRAPRLFLFSVLLCDAGQADRSESAAEG